MQIHELNNYSGNLDENTFLAVDDGADTGKVSVDRLTSDLETEIAEISGRVDNIIAGGAAPSEAEVTDARYGANGITYPSLGAAIRGQVGVIDDQLARMGYTESATPFTPSNYTNGRYWIGNNSWGTNADYFVSARFQLLKGQALEYAAYGVTGVYMLVECDSNYNEVIGGEHIAFGANITTPLIGQFTAPRDMWVSLSVNQTKTNVYRIIDVNYDVLNEVNLLITATNGLIEENTPTYNITTGKYIGYDGLIGTADGYCYSEPIPVSAGDIIDLTGAGYQTNVGMISTCNADGSNISVKAVSAPGVLEYSYTATEDGYIIVSYNNNVAHSLKITKSVINKFSAEIEELRQTPYISLSLFERIGVVGDSYASGELYYNGVYVDKYPISWGQILARKLGITCTNYSAGGLTTRTWLTSGYGLSLMNSSPADNLYILALGINDIIIGGAEYLGSLSDITGHSSYQEYGDTFYGNYGRIIEQIKLHAPNAKIVLSTLASTTELGLQYSSAIIEIANYYNIAYIDQHDDSFFQSSLYRQMSGGHPRAVAYSGMAMAIERLLTECILSNWTYFSDYYMYN